MKELIKYEGLINQEIITSLVKKVELNISDIGIMGNVSTTLIEMCQNMVNYSKNDKENCLNIESIGFIQLYKTCENFYFLKAKNIISIHDKEKIIPKLQDITKMQKTEIREKYRELRKSGKNTHAKGGGIGIYEIGKISEEINYKFNEINKNKHYFTFVSKLKA